jgi:hypothetical protein
MVVLTESERKLLERLAAIGKATQLTAQDLQIAKPLESGGLVFMIRDTANAIITPKGRHVLAGREMSARPAKKPFGFMD